VERAFAASGFFQFAFFLGGEGIMVLMLSTSRLVFGIFLIWVAHHGWLLYFLSAAGLRNRARTVSRAE
jgi:hypothetical protein